MADDPQLIDLAVAMARHAETGAAVAGVLDRVAADARRDYLTQYAVFHEDMHTEAFTYTRQTLGYPTPSIGAATDPAWQAGDLAGDAQIPGGEFRLGAEPGDGFCFEVCDCSPLMLSISTTVSARSFGISPSLKFIVPLTDIILSSSIRLLQRS